MDKFQLLQFQALLKREVLEHKNLFIWAPVVLGLLIFVIDFLIISSLSEEDLESFLNSLTRFFANGQPLDMAPAFVFPTLPFLGILYICAIL